MKIKRYIIKYRGEFSTVVEAKSFNDAMKKVQKTPYAYQWECIGELHNDFFEHQTDDLTEKQLYELGD